MCIRTCVCVCRRRYVDTDLPWFARAKVGIIGLYEATLERKPMMISVFTINTLDFPYVSCESALHQILYYGLCKPQGEW